MMTYKYMRNPAAVMLCKKNSCIFLRQGVAPFVLHDVDVPTICRLMQAGIQPIPQAAVDSLITETLRCALVEQKILLHAPESVLKLMRSKPTNTKPCNRIILGLTGAIASLKMVPIAMEIQSQLANEVDVVLTRDAHGLVKPDAFRYLGIRVWSDTTPPTLEVNVPHIHLAESADFVVVMPASAHTLHKLAHGECSDLLSLTIAATRAPVVLFPAMNGAMWNSAAISRNVNQLREDGFYIVEPELGGEISKPEDQSMSYGVAGWGGMAFADLLRLLIDAQILPRQSKLHSRESMPG